MTSKRLLTVALLFDIAALANLLQAQELTPGAYTPTPVGISFVGVSNTTSYGDLTFDPSIPIEDAHASINTTIFTAGRSLNVGGRMANVLIAVPLTFGKVEGIYRGTFQSRDRAGFADAQVRFGMNLYGAPALELKDFVSQKRKTIFGVSLTAVVPLGQYDSSRVINLGSHRWAFKPELGVSRTFGPWTVEGYAGVWLFTENDNFAGGQVRTQDPLRSFQFHINYTFRPRLWLAFNSNFYTGGRTTVGGTANVDFQKNSRIGATLSVPLAQRHAIKVALSGGAYTTIGADFNAIHAGYQYTWGGGL